MASAKKTYIAKCRIEGMKENGERLITKAGDSIELTEKEAEPLLHVLTEMKQEKKSKSSGEE
jgi:hypothetical protein